MQVEERLVATPQGEGRLVVRRARRPRASLLLGHGAGGGIEARDLVALADALPGLGYTVLRFEQPWRQAGRRIAGPPASLDAALLAVGNTLRTRTPIVVGGRSAGARSAARCSRALGASGVLALSFPLHPPGRPERSRLEELQAVRVPTLVVQGENDAMGRPEEFPAATRLVTVPAADHGLAVPKRAPLTQEEAVAVVVDATARWLDELVG